METELSSLERDIVKQKKKRFGSFNMMLLNEEVNKLYEWKNNENKRQRQKNYFK